MMFLKVSSVTMSIKITGDSWVPPKPALSEFQEGIFSKLSMLLNAQ